MQQSGSASDPCIDPDCIKRTIHQAGAAFHTGIPIHHPSGSAGQFKDLMRTDLDTPAASRTEVLIEPQGSNIFQISETFHTISSFTAESIQKAEELPRQGRRTP
jgi:hypothetical protein